MTQTDAISKNKLRVLIADDFQETRRSIRLMLSMNADVVVVAIAKDGQQAVEMAKEQQPDILVMDINMPKIDGLTAYKEISRINPNTGCVIVTGQRELDPLDTAMSVGAHEYLLKPFTIEDLNGAVNRVAASLAELRQKTAEEDRRLKNSEAYLKTAAIEYQKSRRSDDEALRVFEQLAENPKCDLHWLRTLAMVYVIRQEWAKLKALSARLEEQAEHTNE